MLGTCMPDPGLALDKDPLLLVNSRSYLGVRVGIIDASQGEPWIVIVVGQPCERGLVLHGDGGFGKL